MLVSDMAQSDVLMEVIIMVSAATWNNNATSWRPGELSA
jgi:hypothetical protein